MLNGRNQGSKQEIFSIVCLYPIIAQYNLEEQKIVSDLNRGIMKFDGADKPIVVAVSAILIFAGIIVLIFWALKSAYVV